MGNHFVNTKEGKEELRAQGWGASSPYNSNRITNISDSVNSGLALHKMGTSIPHPFARLFIFNTAFDEVNAEGSETVETSYAKLTSECLDLLEFLYQYGGNKKDLTIKRWDKDTEIEKLKNSQFAGHRLLASSLSKAIDNITFEYNEFNEEDDEYNGNSTVSIPVGAIYLFYYKGALLGGTSPYSLVFTSPNIRKNLEEVNVNLFKGLNDNELFQDYSERRNNAIPLDKRSEEFRRFIYHFYFANQQLLKNTSIGKYIKNIGNNIDKKIWNELMLLNPEDHKNQFDENGKYDVFSSEINGVMKPMNILSGTDLKGKKFNIPLGHRRQSNEATVSRDYEIVPDADLIQEGEVLPLVLNQTGLHEALFINGLEFPEGMNFDNISESDIQNRVLPSGQNVRYPFVYADDFLEDHLIDLPYEIDEHFIGLKLEDNTGDHNFMLPIKPFIFKFFKVESLEKMIGISKTSLGYKVTLKVPISFRNKSIELYKEIKKEDVFDLRDKGKLRFLGMALFPSYKVVNNESLNIYRLMVSAENCKPVVTFYRRDKEIDSELRVKNNAKFYSIDSSFDAAQVKINEDIRGLVVPLFYPVTVSPNNNVVVGVDFGTTNTYVCLKRGTKPITTLSIDTNKPQILTYNKPNLSKGNKSTDYKKSMEYNGIDDFYNIFMRQMVPHILGEGKDIIAAFPYRTIAYEDINFKTNHNEAGVFSDISIGFNNLNESVDLSHHKYISNIKWLLSSGSDRQADKKRVELFIFELAWMIKNAIMLDDDTATNTPTIYTTYPSAMYNDDKEFIQEAWQNSFDKLMGKGNVKIDSDIVESVAPFLFNNKKLGANFVNIDIGGGTTDILYIDVENTKMYGESNKFAGNDLWGDGVIKDSKKDNPFVKEMENMISSGKNAYIDSTEKQKFEKQKELAEDSSDIMSYIFSNESIYDPATFIKENDSLKSALFVHFAAIIYHVAKVIKELGMDNQPLRINFSGMGSKYINIILKSSKNKEEVINAIFQDLGLHIDDVSLMTLDEEVSPKEITARGAVKYSDEDTKKKLDTYSNGKKEPMEILLDRGKIKYYAKREAPTKSEILSFKEEAIQDYLDFIDNLLMKPQGYFNELMWDKYKINLSDNFIKALKDKNTIRSAYEEFSNTLRRDTDRTKESVFFWPLKETLISAADVKE